MTPLGFWFSITGLGFHEVRMKERASGFFLEFKVFRLGRPEVWI